MASKVSALILTEIVPRLQITSGDTRLTYAQLLGYTQKVYEDLYYSITQSNPEVYGSIGYVASNANSVSAALSANLTDYDKSINILKVEIKQSASAQYYVGREIEWSDITNPNASFATNAPTFTIYGDNIYMQPTFTAAVVSAAKVYFTDRVSNLSGGVAHNLPSGWEDTLINGVVQYGYDHLGDVQKSTKFLQEYERGRLLNLSRINNRTRTRSKRMTNVTENYFGSSYEGGGFTVGVKQ